MVNLDLYRVFYTVAKCGSLTKAAEELYISQPAVSQSIKQLESQLGVSLFNRTHRGMELSAQGGKMIFAKVEKALELFAEAETVIAQVHDSAKGILRIGASETIFRYFLADKIVRFHEQYPAPGRKCRVGRVLQRRCDHGLRKAQGGKREYRAV